MAFWVHALFTTTMFPLAPTTLSPRTTKVWFLLLALLINGAAHGDNDGAFSHLFTYHSTTSDWDYCGLEYSEEVCDPTISIEQCACEAPLVVYGRVLQVIDDEEFENSDYGKIQIQVNYRSQAFGEQPQGVPKWGAGVENDVEDSVFYGDSGFFTTWVSGFNNEPSVLGSAGFGTTPCGTKTPNAQEELYFFLKELPENEGTTVDLSDTGILSVNFTLSTTMLQSGQVPASLEAWDYVRTGIFNDDNKLKGDCQVVYCCYNPDCGDCADVFEKYPNFQCQWTDMDMETESKGIRLGMGLALLLAAAIALLTDSLLD
jgi:hypothetical protein